jgi:hypothetical protein
VNLKFPYSPGRFLIVPFYSQGNRGTEQLSKLLRGTLIESGKEDSNPVSLHRLGVELVPTTYQMCDLGEN